MKVRLATSIGALVLLVAAFPTAAAAADLQGREADRLREEIDQLQSFWSLILLPMSILVGLLVAGGIVGIITSLRYERRQTQLYEEERRRGNEIHALTITGETAAQERASESHEKFLDDSHETLTLVNDTLRLAKEASERAEQALEEKAAERLHDINRDAEQVISAALDRGDFKVVVRDAWIEEQLEDVAERLRGIQDFAEAHGLELSSYCLFAKGLDRHLRAAPERAIDNWCKAAERSENPELSALARFWVGYERNNIGQFQKAAKAFRLARELDMPDTDQVQHYELRRIEVQSRFFAAAKEHFRAESGRRDLVEEFVSGLDQLLGALDSNRKDFQEERWQCEQTAGELLVWSARMSPLERQPMEPFSSEERTALEEAGERFKKAGDLIWARFAHAQVRWALGEELSGGEYESLLHTLMTEAWSHREPRSLALRHAGILIAEGEHHDGEEKLNQACRDLWNDLGHIRGQLTVFSPWQKANVKLDHFEEEVRAYQRASQIGA